MKAAELKAEIESSLLRGMRILLAEGLVDPLYADTLTSFCRERAANLTQGLASRTLSEATATEIVAMCDDQGAIRMVLSDLDGER